MCYLLLSINRSEHYPLIIAANRDEFYQRQSAPLSFWIDKPHILGGRDVEQGGTWMAVNESGKFAAITNYREPGSQIDGQRSRGLIITDYLDTEISEQDFANKLSLESHRYNGFNLIYGRVPNELFYYSNRNSSQSIALKNGVHALSNHLIDTPWPKVVHGKNKFKNLIKKNSDHLVSALFKLLKDPTIAEEHELPETGLDKEFEQLLSSIYIESSAYGTRCSSVLLMDKQGKLEFIEYTYQSEKKLSNNPSKKIIQL